MGLSPFKNCSVYPDYCEVKKKKWTCPVSSIQAPLAPDPINFEILEIIQVKHHVVAKIKYPDCTNFEGIKICLFVYMTVNEVKSLKEIDPHFSTESTSPFARFKPNEVGWKMAIEMAKMI